jgi:hypothetical protein
MASNKTSKTSMTRSVLDFRIDKRGFHVVVNKVDEDRDIPQNV